MSTVENSQWCPKCGAALESSESARTEAAPGTPVCDACGKPLAQSLVTPGTENAAGFPMQGAARPRGKRNPLALVVVAVVAAGMLYFGFHMARRAGSENAEIMKHGPAPDFALETLDGKTMKLSDLRGKAVLLNFWATWCDPCRSEIPELIELQQKYAAKGFTVLGVDVDEEGPSAVTKFVDKERFDVNGAQAQINYPTVVGSDDTAEQLGGLFGYPTTILIGRDGKEIKRLVGPINYDEMSHLIESHL